MVFGRVGIVFFGVLLLAESLGCGGTPGQGKSGDSATPSTSTSGEAALEAYARACEVELGPLPSWEVAADTLEVPVTVDGVALGKEDYSDATVCDRPDLLRRSCMPGSRIGRQHGRTAAGSVDPDVWWVITFRQVQGATDASRFDDVAMIGHRESTGATCFFQAYPDAAVARVPSPSEAEGGDLAWVDPQTVDAVECVRCHGADPWIHSPWVDQLRDPADPDQPYVPSGADRLRPYRVVGEALDRWNDLLVHISPEGNACVSCHRIGLQESCERLVPYATGRGGTLPLSATGSTFPQSHWMPPESLASVDDWSEAWDGAVQELVDCCRSPDQPHCNRSSMPGPP